MVSAKSGQRRRIAAFAQLLGMLETAPCERPLRNAQVRTPEVEPGLYILGFVLRGGQQVSTFSPSAVGAPPCHDQLLQYGYSSVAASTTRMPTPAPSSRSRGWKPVAGRSMGQARTMPPPPHTRPPR